MSRPLFWVRKKDLPFRQVLVGEPVYSFMHLQVML